VKSTAHYIKKTGIQYGLISSTLFTILKRKQKWAVPTLEDGGITYRGAKRRGGCRERWRWAPLSTLFSEVTVDQKLGNWYHFVKPTHHIKHLLTVTQLQNVSSYFIVIIFSSGLCKLLF
jgi:hypothetical protein